MILDNNFLTIKNNGLFIFTISVASFFSKKKQIASDDSR